MTDQVFKNLGVKFPGSNREAETISIEPGTTVRDALRALGLGGDYTLTDPSQPDAVFRSGDNLFAKVQDGDMLAASALVDAGHEEVCS